MSCTVQLSFSKASPSLTDTSFAQVITLAGSGASTTFTWTQSIPLSVWTIPHNLDKFPSASIVDNLGNLVYSDVIYVDRNIIQVIHGAPFSGCAYLN